MQSNAAVTALLGHKLFLYPVQRITNKLAFTLFQCWTFQFHASSELNHARTRLAIAYCGDSVKRRVRKLAMRTPGTVGGG